MRNFYDGVNASLIKKNAPTRIDGVLGYVDGLYKWSLSDWALFSGILQAGIAVHASTDAGTILDCETGDASPAQCPGWVQMRRKAGVDPTVYCNKSTWPAVRQAFQSAKIAEPHYWIAEYDNDPAPIPGAVAKQWYNDDHLGFDRSSVAGAWPGVDSAHAPLDANVVKLQELLNQNGAHLSVDGDKGPHTKSAFTAAMSHVGTLSQGASGTYVKLLQAMLNTWGSLKLGQLSVDGQFGPATAHVVKSFQAARHVPHSVVNGHGDGNVGPATKAALAE